jgi:hypothetical protein
MRGTRGRVGFCLLLLFGILLAAGAAQQVSSPAGESAPSTAKAAVAPSDRVVLKVGNVQLTQAQFETIIHTLEEQQGTTADLDRRTLGDNYASLLMLSQQAVANHLESSPDVVRQLEIDRTQILSNAEYKRLDQQAQPTPEEISRYYSAHLDEFDEVQIRRLFIFKKAEGAKSGRGLSPQDADALAKSIREAYTSGGDAKKLIPKTDDVVFDLDPLSFPRGDLPPFMEKAAFSMKDGEWSVLEDKPDGLIMIQLVKHVRQSLTEVSPSIQKTLQGQKMREALQQLKKNAGVWLDEQYFASPAAPGTAAPKPASSSSPELRPQENHQASQNGTGKEETKSDE